jgi:hypothetical protein
MSDTAPLTPADCDLRDFAFMPLDIVRLFNSRFHAIATDAEWRAGVTLWLKSFHQIPAGSLPDDEVELCRLAELGRDTKAWRKLRTVALHGWIACSDGRFYHPTVCEKANEAWQRKLMQRERSKRGNAKRWGGDSVSETPDPQDGGGQPGISSRPSGNAGGERAASPNNPSSIPQGSPKDSPKDAARTPLTIPRDRDSDRDREKKKDSETSETVPGATPPVDKSENSEAGNVTVLPSSITAEIGQLTARLEGRARGQPFLTPKPNPRTVDEQLAIVAPPAIRPRYAPPEVLAEARRQLAERGGAA